MRKILLLLSLLLLLSVFVVADTQEPQVTIDAPSEASKDSEVTITVDVSDDTEVDEVLLSYGDGEEESKSCAQASCSLNFFHTYSFTGTLTIDADVNDSSGNLAIASSEIEIITTNPPQIGFDTGSFSESVNTEYGFTVDVTDVDSDFKIMQLFENDNLVESLISTSPECSNSGCTQIYSFNKGSPGEYVYRIDAEDDQGHESSEQITVTIGDDKPILQAFTIGNTGSGGSLELLLNDTKLFAASAYSDTVELEKIDIDIEDEECSGTTCDVQEGYTFDFLGEETYEARAYTVSGASSDKKEITVNVLCPQDHPCCTEGNNFWNEKPSTKEDGCYDGRYTVFTCSGERIEKELTGQDSDADGFDVECGDCADSNEYIFPLNENPFCDCNQTINPTAQSEDVCDDNFDNDCDGKIDCFDEDCPSYDPEGCKLECPPGEIKCPTGACINLMHDVDNCGACGNACEPLQNSIMICDQGECDVGECKQGYDNCELSSPDCETHIMTDSKNCGKCGKVCAAGYSCLHGECTKGDDIVTTNTSEDCIHGDSVSCVTDQGCVGQRTCQDGSYGYCECLPRVEMISPNKTSYDTQQLSLIFNTNMLPEKCLLHINEDKIQRLYKKEADLIFPEGQNNLLLDCGGATDTFDFTVDPKDRLSYPNEFTYSQMNIPDMTNIDKESRTRFGRLVDDLSIKEEYYATTEDTQIKFNVIFEKPLVDTDLFIRLPACARDDNITFLDENFENIDDETFRWSYQKIGSPLEMSLSVDRMLEKECIRSFGILVAGSYDEEDESRMRLIYYFLPIPIAIIVIVIIFLLSSRPKLNKQEVENVKMIIEARRGEGYDDQTIRQQFEQDGLNEQLINKAFSKAGK